MAKTWPFNTQTGSAKPYRNGADLDLVALLEAFQHLAQLSLLSDSKYQRNTSHGNIVASTKKVNMDARLYQFICIYLVVARRSVNIRWRSCPQAGRWVSWRCRCDTGDDCAPARCENYAVTGRCHKRLPPPHSYTDTPWLYFYGRHYQRMTLQNTR